MGAAERTPMPMEGHGGYNRRSHVQAAGLAPAIARLEAAAAQVPVSAPLVVADYGASQGHNSLAPVGAALTVLRARAGPASPVSVVHTDLPGNDFSALFATLLDDPDSYLRGDPNVFPSAVGRSFYGAILPPASVTLGWSSWSVQWLSRVPAAIPDQVQVAYSKDAPTQALYAAQAAADWRDFLGARAGELRPGGRLVVLGMATDDAGDFGYGAQLDACWTALQAMVEDGSLAPDELRAMAIPTVGRTRAEWEAPFARGSAGGLILEMLELFGGEDRIFERFTADGDGVAFGAAWAAFMRGSVFPTLAAALQGGDADARRGAFVARLERRVAQTLAAAPQPTTIPLAMMTISGPA